MKTILFALAFAAASGAAQADCGDFDTAALRRDIDAPFRTDALWYEMVLKMLAWQLDCERQQHNRKDGNGSEKRNEPRDAPGEEPQPRGT